MAVQFYTTICSKLSEGGKMPDFFVNSQGGFKENKFKNEIGTYPCPCPLKVFCFSNLFPQQYFWDILSCSVFK